MFDQPFRCFLAAFAADEGNCQRLASCSGFFLSVVNGFRDFLWLSDGRFTIEYNHAIHPGVRVSIFDAFIITCQTSTASDIDRVFGGTKRRHVLAQFCLHVFRGEFEGQTVLFCCIGCQNANAATIGDDQEVVAFHGRLKRERQCGVEHVVQIFCLGNASLLERGFVDLGTTSQRAGVRGCSGSTMGGSASFECDDRFGAFTGGFHEFGSVFDAFDVERNTGSAFVFVQVRDQVCKIEVSLVTDGDHFVETDTAGVGRGSHSDQKRTALRNKGSLAFIRQVIIERSVHLVAIGENTNNIRTDDAHTILMGDLDDFLFESVVANFAETGGDDAETLYTFFTCIARNFRYKSGRNSDDSHVHHIRDILDVGVAFVTENFFGVRVDWIDRVLVTTIHEVFDYLVTDLFGVGRRTDNCDTFWF